MNEIKINERKCYNNLNSIYSSRTFNLPLASLFVETLDVTSLADVQRSIDENFKERKTSIFVNFPSAIAILNGNLD